MNKLQWLSTLMMLALFLSACTTTRQANRDIEETAIYTLHLDEDPAEYIIGSPIIIQDKTEYFEISDVELWSQRMPALLSDTLRDYQASNQQPQVINYALSLERPYAYVSESELDVLIGEFDDWTGFNAKYPDTHVYTFFSKVGFNDDMSQALVYMAHSCGGECGNGNLYLLARRGSRWEIVIMEDLWSS
jgi:hypothetical protein